MSESNDDVERIAMWLHSSARMLGKAEIVRSVIRTTINQARDGDGELLDDDEYSEDEITALMTRFASHWDECERQAKTSDDEENNTLNPLDDPK